MSRLGARSRRSGPVFLLQFVWLLACFVSTASAVATVRSAFATADSSFDSANWLAVAGQTSASSPLVQPAAASPSATPTPPAIPSAPVATDRSPILDATEAGAADVAVSIYAREAVTLSGWRVRRFAVLGDSLSAWAFAPGSSSPTTSGTWPSLLAEEDPSLVLVKNSGVPGNTTGQMLDRLQHDVLDYNPDLLFILGGTNDIGLDRPEASILATIRQIVDGAKAHGVAVVLLDVPPSVGLATCRSAKLQLNTDLATLARAEGIPFVDDFAALATPDGDLAVEYAAADGLHLSQSGEKALADAVERVLHPRVPPPHD